MTRFLGIHLKHGISSQSAAVSSNDDTARGRR